MFGGFKPAITALSLLFVLMVSPLSMATASLRLDPAGFETDAGRALKVAKDALETAGADSALRAVASTNLETANSLSRLDPKAGSFERSLAAAREATLGQARILGVTLPETPSRAPFLSLAVHDLLALHSVAPTPDAAAALERIDGVPAPVVHALAQVIDAQVAHERAARALMATSPWPEPGTQSDPSWLDTLRAAELGPALAARLRLLDAARALHEALQESALATSAPIELCPALSIDLEGVPSVRTEDCALVIDLGGNDVYHNNAGGTGSCGGQAPLVAAALFDFGSGADRYGDPSAPRSCGVNGGGSLGSGFLLDAGGDDAYVGGDSGVNGGAMLGLGTLVDADGSDTYTAGGAPAICIGAEPGSCGVNGGANVGVGLLVDGLGPDAYAGGGDGSNGGASFVALGSLVDLSFFPDTYRGGRRGVNGGAEVGAGFLYDEGGADEYNVTAPPLLTLCFENAILRGSCGVNGGGATAGVGFLYDGGGSDVYRADSHAANGGSYQGLGLLVEVSGAEVYRAGDAGVNGGGVGKGSGILVDASGNDDYLGGSRAANGGCQFAGGSGTLIDLGGNDMYTAGDSGTNGGCGQFSRGLLLDAGGSDVYLDSNVPSGSGTDRTVVPKGLTGAQVDLPIG